MEKNHVLKNSARIWTFDGGGPSVISQLIIVNEIMHQIQWILEINSVPRPCEFAELMIGSGLGAVAVILLARLRLTAEQTLIHLIELGQLVFLEPNISKDGYQFDVERLKASTMSILRQHGLTDATKMIEEALTPSQMYAAVTSAPTSNLSQCRLIRTYRTPSAEYNCTIVEAVLAVMAAPNWFPPVKIGPVYSKESLTSGVLGFSNPTKKALDEAKRVFGAECKASIILSFGSGRRSPRILDNTTTDKLRQVLDDMAHSGEETAEELSQRFEDSPFYRRFSVDSGLENLIASGWTDSDLEAITSHTKAYIERVSSSLSAAVRSLVKNEESVTFGQLTQVKVKPANAKSIPHLSPFFIERGCFMNLATLNGYLSFMGWGEVEKHRLRRALQSGIRVETTIKADLQSSIRSLGGVHSQDSHEDALQFLVQTDNPDWLVIFDNADDPKLSPPTYLPECDHGTVIITGRNHAHAVLAPNSHWHLRGMDESDSMQVLLRASKYENFGNEEESTAAAELCRLLGGLPLALVHVGCYCHMTKITFSQYLERFKTHRSKLMEMQPPSQLDKYSYSTYTSISLSYGLLDHAARALLHLFVFFHPSSIDLDILRAASKYKFEVPERWNLLPRTNQHNDQIDDLKRLLTPNNLWSDLHIDSLLNQLQSFSLVSLSLLNGQTNVTTHPLVQLCLRDALSSLEYSHYLHMAVLVLSSCSPSEEIALFRHLPSHIAELESCKEYIHPNDLACLAYILLRNGSYEEAIKRWEKVRDECEKVNGDQHRSTLRISFWIATCLYRMFKYEEAEEMIREVAKAQKTVLGADDDDTSDSYRLIARILSKHRKTEEAETVLKRLLMSRESKYGQEDRRTLDIQRALAENLYNQQRYSEAEAMSRSALSVMKKVLGEEEATTLHNLNNLSIALIGQGKWAEAEDILSDLITKRKRKYGSNHPNTLISRYHFALCLLEREDLHKAQKILQEVVEVQEKTFGKDHEFTIQTRKSLETLEENPKFEQIQPSISPNPSA